MSLNYKPELKKIMNTVKKSIPTIRSDSGIRNIYSILNNTHGELIKLSRQIPVRDHNKPLNPGKRSFRENLFHILNVETLNTMIIIQALTLEKPDILAIHAERDIGKLLLFDSLSIIELISYIKIRRKILIKLLLSLSDEQWSRQITEKNKQRRESVYWRARTLALHEYEHIQIIKFQLK